jgi:hypothetical protein
MLVSSINGQSCQFFLSHSLALFSTLEQDRSVMPGRERSPGLASPVSRISQTTACTIQPSPFASRVDSGYRTGITVRIGHHAGFCLTMRVVLILANWPDTCLSIFHCQQPAAGPACGVFPPAAEWHAAAFWTAHRWPGPGGALCYLGRFPRAPKRRPFCIPPKSVARGAKSAGRHWILT